VNEEALPSKANRTSFLRRKPRALCPFAYSTISKHHQAPSVTCDILPQTPEFSIASLTVQNSESTNYWHKKQNPILQGSSCWHNRGVTGLRIVFCGPPKDIIFPPPV